MQNFIVLYVEISISSVGSSLKWTVLGQKGRSEGVKVDGPKGLKLDGLRKWTVPKYESGRSQGFKVDGLRA